MEEWNWIVSISRLLIRMEKERRMHLFLLLLLPLLEVHLQGRGSHLEVRRRGKGREKGGRMVHSGGVVGDKARSSIGPKGGAPNQEIDNALLSKEMNCMKIGGDEKINPWDRDV